MPLALRVNAGRRNNKVAGHFLDRAANAKPAPRREMILDKTALTTGDAWRLH